MAAGLFYVCTDPGTAGEAEFHDWYDHEHGPARLAVPGFRGLDLAAWYAEEHIPMLLAVPGWRRIRRYRLVRGMDSAAPDFLSLHELAGPGVLEDPAYRAAVSTPWRDRVVASALRRERRVFGLRNAVGC
jgi:hypothetical protein